MSEAIAAQPYTLMVGHWKDEVYAIHGPNGHIASGVSPVAAKAIVDELNAIAAPRAVVPSVTVPEGWKPEGPVTADHPLECLIVLPALRQSDGDWFSHGTFVCEGEVLAWRPDTPEGRAALHDPRIDSAAAPAPQPGAEGRVGELEALLREAYGYTTAATNLLPERIKAAIAKGGEG